MPELRQNVITRDWVIISTGRTHRPDQFVQARKQPLQVPAYVPDCPFCVGNESQTQKEVFSLQDDQGWKIRVVPNKFPALEPFGQRKRKIEGIYRSMSGVGVHDVVIEHRRHDMTTALMKPREVSEILRSP